MSALLSRVRYGIYVLVVGGVLAFGAGEASADQGSLNCIGVVVGTCTSNSECRRHCIAEGYGFVGFCDATTGCCHCE